MHGLKIGLRQAGYALRQGNRVNSHPLPLTAFVGLDPTIQRLCGKEISL